MKNLPTAYLYANGNAMFFGPDGEQLTEIQSEGLCGLHEFVCLFPDAPVYWADWDTKTAFVVPKTSLIELLKCLRKTRRS